MKRVVMVHGWEGYPEDYWRPILKKQLLKKGYQVDNLAMPNTTHPKMTEWVEHLKQAVGTPNEDTILLGHSLGCITILRYLEELRETDKVGTVIFLAGFSHDLEYKDYKGELSNFFQAPVNFEEVKKHSNKFIVLHSKDDPWVDIKHAYIFKEKLHAETIIQEGMIHYSEPGMIELPIVLTLIEKNS